MEMTAVIMALGALQVVDEQFDVVQAHQEADGCDTCRLEAWTVWILLLLNSKVTMMTCGSRRSEPSSGSPAMDTCFGPT